MDVLRRARTSFILALVLLTLLISAATLASSRAHVVAITSLIFLCLIASVMALKGVVTDGGPGERAAAIVALVALAGILLAFVMVLLTPREQGANIGAGIIATFSFPTFVISSLVAWLRARSNRE
jgi:uncharacterized membrane protein YhaH (DUF805 family)